MPIYIGTELIEPTGDVAPPPPPENLVEYGGETVSYAGEVVEY